MIRFLRVLVIMMMISSCDGERSRGIGRIDKGEYERLMSLDLDQFDQTPDGWRKYSSDFELTAFLIQDYIERHHLSDNSAKNLYFHKGQVLAFDEQYEKAIDAMSRSFSRSGTPAGFAWNLYVNGTISFLKKDKEKLNLYVDSLMNADNNMNSEVLLRLQAKFGESYAAAYSSN